MSRKSLTLAVAVVFSLAAPTWGAGTSNPYRGTQTREDVFEFTQKPSVKKEGEKWVITFASKGKCDATVAILDKNGTVVRHLASGVLGENAPHPFQQNALEQRLEWDGLTDTFEKAPAGCTVRVALGLTARFERNFGWDPYDLPTHPSNQRDEDRGKLLTATGSDEVMTIDVATRTVTHTATVYRRPRGIAGSVGPPGTNQARAHHRPPS